MRLSRCLIFLIVISCIFPLLSIGGGALGGFKFGINIYYSILLVVSIPSFFILVTQKIPIDKNVKNVLILLSIFILYSVSSSFLYPKIFDGILVYSPRVGGLDPLRFTMSNFGQSVYLILNGLFVVFFISTINDREQFDRYYLKALEIAACVLIFFVVWQVISKWYGIYYPYEVLFTLLDRGLYKQEMAGLFRINGTMSEPSDLGRILSCFLAFSLLSMYKTKEKNKYLLLSILIFLCLFLSTSSTGLGASSLLTMLFLFLLVCQTIITLKIKKNIIYTIVGGLVLFLFIYLLFFEQVNKIVELALLQKTESHSFDVRLNQDIHSLEVFSNTYFLGAGLGSNRPSSFLAFIISNLGLIGLLVLVPIMVLVTKTYLKYRKHDSYLDITFATFIAAIIAKSISGPDISDSYLWVFFAGLLVNLNLVGRKSKTSKNSF